MEYIIDRFEENKAILEYDNGKFKEIDKNLLPQQAKEGDCVVEKNGRFSLNKEKTAELKEDIDSLMNELFK